MNGRLLKERMKLKGIKSERLAVMLGVSLSTVTNMRAGKDVEEITQHKAEEILGLTAGVLSGAATVPESTVSPQSAKASTA